jgi:hypothetical protein
MNAESIFKQRLISVAVLDRLEDAMPLAEALLAGGQAGMAYALDCLRAGLKLLTAKRRHNQTIFARTCHGLCVAATPG